jgi:D-alanine-D-alanine ligase
MCIGVGDESIQFIDQDFSVRIEAAYEKFGQPVLVQEFVTGEEVGVPIIRVGSTHALPPVAFRRANGEPFGARPRTFEDENVTQDTSHIPFEGAAPVVALLQQAAIHAFDALEMAGVGRIDFRVDADGRPWVIDTNESPPPLAETSYATAMSGLGFSLEEMLAVWIGACLLEYGLLQESDQKDSSQQGTSRE